MLKFAIGVVAGASATLAYGVFRFIRSEGDPQSIVPPVTEVVSNRVLEMRKDLLEKMLNGPRPNVNAENLHKYYKEETARLDAIYYGQESL